MPRFLHMPFILLKVLKLLTGKEKVHVEWCLHEEVQSCFPDLNTCASIHNMPPNLRTETNLFLVFLSVLSLTLELVHVNDFFLNSTPPQILLWHCIFILYKGMQLERCYPNEQYTVSDYVSYGN